MAWSARLKVARHRPDARRSSTSTACTPGRCRRSARLPTGSIACGPVRRYRRTLPSADLPRASEHLRHRAARAAGRRRCRCGRSSSSAAGPDCCQASTCRQGTPVRRGGEADTFALWPHLLCNATGVTVEKGQRYRVEIALPEACTADEASAPATARRTGAWTDWKIPVTQRRGFLVAACARRDGDAEGPHDPCGAVAPRDRRQLAGDRRRDRHHQPAADPAHAATPSRPGRIRAAVAVGQRRCCCRARDGTASTATTPAGRPRSASRKPTRRLCHPCARATVVAAECRLTTGASRTVRRPDGASRWGSHGRCRDVRPAAHRVRPGARRQVERPPRSDRRSASGSSCPAAAR